MAPPGPLHQRPNRILMLHGFTQSGDLFRAKTRPIEKALEKAFPGVELVYPTAPIALNATNDLPSREESQHPADDCWGWWRAREPRGAYVGLEQSLEYISDLLRCHGPFDGVVGFSQGAAAAAMVAALLEPARHGAFAVAHEANSDSLALPAAVTQLDHPSLRFLICYSGFSSEHQPYAAFYAPPIATPSLHFIGGLDTVVDESWSQALVAHCERGTATAAFHPGGHFVPTGKREVAVVVDFIRKVYAAASDKEQTAEGARCAGQDDVLDMDVPF